MRWGLPVVVGIGGLVAGASVAALGGIPASDAADLLISSTVGAAIAGGIAALVLRALRPTTVGTQAAVAALAPVVAVGMGVAWATARMFLMAHDLRVLWVVLCSAGGVGLIISILLGRQVAGAVRSVGDMARRLGESGPGTDLAHGQLVGPAESAAPVELAALAAELQQASVRLAAAQDQAMALERSRRELVAWVSHDLRTPLAGIRAMVEALEDGVVDDLETVARYHRTMRREADRLAGLVNDLFELSRIQSGSLSLTFDVVPLEELVADAISGAAVAAAAKGIELRSHVRQPSTAELSTPEMARVVRNLVDNAIRHTAAGGTITVDAGLDEPGPDGVATAAVVSVLDGCGGIPEHDLDQVFEMAYRGDAARTPGDGGGGLGLAVARGLVEAHHGEISVQNEGPGCRFVVRVPRRRS
ncbi:MAG: ATP-binding protein [Actinomycetota bacterium]|nr:ATP-binding protein [Actinomycetota bacterium]